MRYTLDLTEKYALLADLQSDVAESTTSSRFTAIMCSRRETIASRVWTGFSQSAFNSDNLQNLVRVEEEAP